MGDPYRTPEVPPEERPAEPDADPEITTQEGHRTRALLVEPNELERGGERAIEHRELIRCESCSGKGCSVCDQRGGTIKKSTVRVRWEAGTQEGEVVTLEGRGDVPGLRRDRPARRFPDGRGDFLVRMSTKKKLFRSIENAERRRQKRQRAFLDERSLVRSQMKAQLRRALIGFAVIVVGLGGLAGVAWLQKHDFGEPCKGPSDCHSSLCVESTGFVLGKGGFTEKTCSKRCDVDADCPGGTVCANIEMDDGYGIPTGKTIRACGHR